ncbi:PREDICTED: TMV resistance protein N-like [Prunus mume]|uniref:TMV resistance protein N-like n=1 Tax=Prunus mume TaxID=102107 RepID=A0ABM0NYW7_PRUMU|nr:PREDICTED: TMV resistance protein N-like [Prunus mume]
MTTESSSNLLSSSSSTSRWKYDIFLSCRRNDSCRNFKDHLYAALNQRGIFTIGDDDELERGREEAMPPELSKAIEESRYVILVLSQNYANSTRCLDELVKALECSRLMGQTILPIFYDVEPSDVLRQRGSFAKAFSEYERVFKNNKEKVYRWRDALKEVANLTGWNLQDGFESRVIQTIVEWIFNELNESISSVSKDLVGIDSRVKEILSYLELETWPDDVQIIGISGMKGIGKTTIARVVFDSIRARFEACSFLADIREVTDKQGPTHLQKQLLSDLLKRNVNIWNVEMGINVLRERLHTKKVLIVLDDVDQLEQLAALCDRSCFGSGSRIIITSRDERLLSTFGVDKVYEVEPLTDEEAFKLFSSKAFKKDVVGEEFLELSKNVVEFANGLPLALKGLGSFLFGRSIKEWSSALDRLKENPAENLLMYMK